MKDNELKLLLIIGVIGVVVLPYFLYSQQAKIDTATLENECVELQSRYDRLEEMNKNREFYLEKTEEYNEQRDKIIELFPADIDQAKYTMFLLYTEYSTLHEVVVGSTNLVDEDGNYIDWIELQPEHPIRFNAVTYGTNVETPISSAETDTGLVALTNTSAVSYACYYGGFKYLLDYLESYDDPMIYTSITADYDTNTGVIEGEITLAQYAVSGNDRDFEPVSFQHTFDGHKFDFDIDNYGWMGSDTPALELRGNEEYGVFGPNMKDLMAAILAAANADPNATTENTGDAEETEE